MFDRMTTNPNSLVAGERVADLLPVLRQLRPSKRSDEMYECRFSLEQDVSGPFLRALMRVEAELLLQDADRLTGSWADWRTSDQRRADAFVALTLRVADAATTSG